MDQALPGGYFAAMEVGVARVQARLDAEPRATLRDIEQAEGWRHFPHANLAVDDVGKMSLGIIASVIFFASI